MDTRFVVEHVEVFRVLGKKPYSMEIIHDQGPKNGTLISLPVKMRTASHSAACGIPLDVGNEYLLAGEIFVITCNNKQLLCQELWQKGH